MITFPNCRIEKEGKINRVGSICKDKRHAGCIIASDELMATSAVIVSDTHNQNTP